MQNQQKSSWIDDPFNLGKNFVMELTPISHKKALSNYAEDLVGQYAKYDDDTYELSLSDLPIDEQNELARLYLEASNRDTSECIYGDDFTINSEYTCALLSMLKDDCNESRERFANVTRANILTYYKTPLNDVLEVACDNFLHMQMNEQGYYAQQDNHGDVVWGKF
ncbi:hypothetical protein UFOVP100_23 [uncultured Caudovirales phage]|uniref:Uncharacterized protein n=1 Tax=uncultured Caudovirales phage TaxID=2100421 RepID=A0A6J5L942_9CAUD|nr:hypothetical protein UFOVP100_23 [uncultured Caudovirales phage]